MYTKDDEIKSLNSKINSLKYQIKQMQDFKEENIRLKKGLDNSYEAIKKINEEKYIIENKISDVFNSIKKLIVFKGTEYSKIKSSYNKDIIERMRKDNKTFEEKITIIERETKALLDDLYSKVKQYCSKLNSGVANNNSMVDIEAIKFILQNIYNQFNYVFTEIKNILNLSSQHIAEEEEETLRNINMLEIIVEEADRLLRFVPNNELRRNNILGQMGINANNYPLNTPTLRIMLINMQEIKRRRQTQLRYILDEIKMKSENVLTKKGDIEKEINKTISQVNDQNKNNDKIGENLTIENIFMQANQTNKKNIDNFKNDSVGKLKKETQENEDHIIAETFNEENTISQVKSEFKKKWGKIKIDGCESLLEHVKNESHIFFERYLTNYENFNEIVKIIKEKFCSPDCDIIKQGLLNCSKTINKIKEDIKPIKCVILLGKKNEYLEKLNDNLVKNLPFLIYNNNKTINDVYKDIEYKIKIITSTSHFEVLFPILVAHFNDYNEFEKDNNIVEEFIINCLKKKIAFLFFFNIKNKIELANINKNINSFIDKNHSIKNALNESKYQLSNSLGCNMETIDFYSREEMKKLTNFKKDIRYKIDKDELKTEYFNKMFDVFNTHSTYNDLLGIKNAQDEITSRQRLLNSIIEYSLICVNLDKKPKTEPLKEKLDLNKKIEAILNNIYNNKILEDFNKFMGQLIQRKTFELYLKREQLMAELDMQYNTSILTEESDNEKTKKIIYQEIENLIEKKHLKEALKYIGRFIWASFFDRFCPKFPKLFEDGFEIPEDFDQYLLESLNKYK